MRPHGLFILLWVAAISLVSFSSGCEFNPVSNLYVIDKGKFIRSRQPDLETLSKLRNEYGIKTIINLRGYSPGKDWYQAESNFAQTFGIRLVDINMSAGRLPHKGELKKLLDAYVNMPRPLLVHCMGGADRTGLASAIYQNLYMGKTVEEAASMLSVKYGHLRFRHPNKLFFWEELWKGEAWARTEYDPCSPKVPNEHYDKEKYCGNGPN